MDKITVALADDHQLVRNGIKLLVQSFRNFEVVCEASNGSELIENINKLEKLPEIALIDISMPVMNGFETISYMAKHHKKVKCIALSVHDDFNTVFRIIDSGGRGYLLKGSSPEEMKETILEVFAKGDSYSSFVVNSLMLYNKNRDEVPEPGKNIPDINDLSKRQIDFVKLCCSDFSYKEIAIAMDVSIRTIDSHRDFVFKKLRVKSRVGLVLFAVDVGLYIPNAYNTKSDH